MPTGFKDPLLAARRRGAKRRGAMIKEAGGALTIEEAAKRLDVTPEVVGEMMEAEGLLSVQIASVPMIPAFQICCGSVVPGLPAVLMAIAVDDPWMRLNFFLMRHPSLGGRRPIDALMERGIVPVVRAAAGFGQQ